MSQPFAWGGQSIEENIIMSKIVKFFLTFLNSKKLEK